MGTSIPVFVGLPGGPELLIILALAVLLFGANKLPSLARSSGLAMGEFKKGRQEIEKELEEAARGTDERAATETEDLTETA